MKENYQAPYAESTEFECNEAVLSASEENFINEPVGTIPGIW